MTPVGQTSRWVAASRALEAGVPQPLFVDPLARHLAGDEGVDLLRRADLARGGRGDAPNPYLSIRTRVFDDALRAAVRDPNLCQVVLLAAGMDARAFRFDWPAGLRWFEVDRPDVLDLKEQLLASANAAPRCDRRVVRIDLRDGWVSALRSAGFDPSRPAAFLIEGLLVYCPPADVDHLFDTLRPIAAPGSWLAADVPNPAVLSSPFMRPYLEGLARMGCPWQFAVDDPVEFFARRGWRATYRCPGEAGADFGRWPYPIAPRSVAGVPRSFLVTALRSNAGPAPAPPG